MDRDLTALAAAAIGIGVHQADEAWSLVDPAARAHPDDAQAALVEVVRLPLGAAHTSADDFALSVGG